MDVQSELNLSQKVANIPLFRNPIRFGELYPGQSVGVRDAYCDLRFKAADHLTKTGVFKSSRLPDARGWDSRLLIEADKAFVDMAVEALRVQLQGGTAKVSNGKEAEKEPEKPLEVSRPTTALVIETAIMALTRDAIDRVMVSTQLDWQYRAQVNAIVKSGGGDVTDDVIGLALNRSLINDSISESFYPLFTTNVIQAIFRVRSRGGERYTRTAFRHDYSDLAEALEREELDITNKGELVHAGSNKVGKNEEFKNEESLVASVAAVNVGPPPRASLPANQQAALPPERITMVNAEIPAVTAKERAIGEFGREAGKSFANKIGEHFATFVLAALVFLLLLGLSCAGLREPMVSLYESIMHPSAQPDRSGTKK